MITKLTTPHTTTSLQFREGSSDKVYHATIEPKDDGFIVTFAYGRRGTTLTAGTKTTAPVTLAQAQAIHHKLITSKIAKGYQLSGESSGSPGAPYQQTGHEGRDSGIRCQLLNAVDESELARLLGDKQHCLQEKHDGRRLLVRKQGNEIIGINRRGLVVALPKTIRRAVEELPVDVLIDGEAVGDTLHVFDLLEVKGNDMRQRGYLHRYAGLLMLIDPEHPSLRPVSTVVEPADKLAMFQTFRQCGCEGVVFKNIDAQFSPGRPNFGGTQLKFKFVESASFVVTGRNAKRSVALGLYDGDKLVSAGNVTIPPNHTIPQVGTVSEVKYLYGFRDSGAIYQPVYLGPRTDIPASECTTDQLKYKSEAA
ncbi:MAG: WGR domain-containing protein [Verrucomicrobiota bacterium]